MELIKFVFKISLIGAGCTIISNVILYVLYPVLTWIKLNSIIYLKNLIIFTCIVIFGAPIYYLWLNCTAFMAYSAKIHASNLFWEITNIVIGILTLIYGSTNTALLVDSLDVDSRISKEEVSISNYIVVLNGWLIILSGLLFFLFPNFIISWFKILIDFWY